MSYSTDAPRGSVFRPSIRSRLRSAEGRQAFGKRILHLREQREEGAVMDRERPSASEEKIPEAWIGQEVMLETTETLSSDLRAAAPVYLEDVNDRGSVITLPQVQHPRPASHRLRGTDPGACGGTDGSAGDRRCVVGADSPAWRCWNCGREWGSSSARTGLRNRPTLRRIAPQGSGAANSTDHERKTRHGLEA